MSVRYHGANIPEIIRFTLGNKARGVMLLFTVLPLILAGVVFVTAPAGLLEKLCKDSFNVFFVGIILTNVDFGIIWRYFGWCNQCIATMVFWSASVYLYKHGRFHYIASIPACFVTYVAIAYMLFEPTMGIRLNVAYANTIAVIATAVIYFLYLTQLSHDAKL